MKLIIAIVSLLCLLFFEIIQGAVIPVDHEMEELLSKLEVVR